VTKYASVVVTTPIGQQPSSYRQRSLPVPPDALDLLLVRHGQSEAYVQGQPFALVDGHGDPPLSELGHEQATRVCDRLADAGIDAIYETTLRRTGQTAAPLAERLGLTPEVEPDLRVVYLGVWEGGLYRKMVADFHPIAQRMFAEERWDVIPGAESLVSFDGRVRGAIGRIAAAHSGQRVAVFTHGGVIGQALALATGSRPFAFNAADNASISRVVVTSRQWYIRTFNDTAHLDGARQL
jgi:probable phosphoglycerate mutase